MNEQNTKKLLEIAPSLYSDTFHFECGDGWFQILFDASKKLEEQIHKYPKSVRQDIVAIEVKEKFGALRFQLSYYTEELDEIIDEVEKMSTCVCETCGAPGKIRGGFWIYAACDSHTMPEHLDSEGSSSEQR